jgi:uncharacterized protein (TIGR00290 family)
MSRTAALVAWSSGKDSAWTLHALRHRDDVEVVGLLTTVNAVHDRVAMHGVRRALLEAQAAVLDLPLRIIGLPSPCSDEAYARIMTDAMHEARAEGIGAVVFGDLHLEDVRLYRERQLERAGIEAIFPLWKTPAARLAEEMLAAGLRAHVTCIDSRKLPAAFAGRAFDAQFLADLPPDIDPCGENGEFHTFVWDGPMFRHPLPVTRGEVVERDGFVFADMCPVSDSREMNA